MSAFFGFTQFKLSTANYHFVTVFNEIMNQIFQIQHTWTTFYKRNIIYAE